METTLAVLLYLIPAFILFYMATEVFLRNRRSLEHRLSSALLLLLTLWFLGVFFRSIFPIAYTPFFSVEWVTPVSILCMGLSFQFYLEITRLRSKMPLWLALAIAYFPFVFMWILLHIRTDWIWQEFVQIGLSKRPIAGPGYVIFMVFTIIYSLLPLWMIWHTRKNSVAIRRRKQYLLLFVGLAGAFWWITLVGIMTEIFPWLLQLPVLDVLGVLIWAVCLWMAMVKYDYLPSYEKRYLLLFELTPAAIVVLDEQRRIREANTQACRLFDLPQHSVRNKSIIEMLAHRTNDSARVEQLKNSRGIMKQYELAIRGHESDETVLAIDSDTLLSENQWQEIWILQDITSLKLSEQKITYMAYHDTLTGLYNRLGLQEQFAKSLQLCETTGRKMAVLLIDLDRFKQLNDEFGHHEGDRLLQHVSAGLNHLVREHDTVARLGGDEFILLMANIPALETAETLAARMLEMIRQPFIVQHKPFYYNVSIGISMYPDNSTDAETLMKLADSAMYQAKESGGGCYRSYKYVEA